MTTPLLSVLVPTHNRGLYARHCIASTLAIDAADLQLVIADTSTDRELHDWLHSEGRTFLADARLKYQHIDYPSNVTRNHNDVMDMADGEFVMVIGDDDCITEAAIEAARWAVSRGVQAVSQTQTSIYAWPDFVSNTVKDRHAGRLYVPRRTGAVRWRRSEDDLLSALDRACQATDHLPRTYHGIVRRKCFLSIRDRTKAFYHGSSPDMSAAIGISCIVSHYMEVDLPLSISGISSGSNSGRSALNKHKGDLGSDPQTKEFQERGWPLGVPKFFAVETVWAHAALSMLELLRPDLLPRFNYARLLGLCRLRHQEFMDEIARAECEAEQLSTHPLNIASEVRRIRLARARYLLGRLAIPTAAHGRRYFTGLANVEAASQCYRQYAEGAGLSFRRIETALDRALQA